MYPGHGIKIQRRGIVTGVYFSIENQFKQKRLQTQSVYLGLPYVRFVHHAFGVKVGVKIIETGCFGNRF